MENIIHLFEMVGKLKDIKRKGWKRVGIENPESVADHSFRSAFIGLLIGEKYDIDVNDLVKMLLIHDLPEALTGDLTPNDYGSKLEKREIEEDALRKLLESIEDSDELIKLWMKFENQDTKEAVIANDIDKLEMALQCLEYQKENPDLDLYEFMLSAIKEIESKEIKEILDELLDSS